jgi:nifR3 family TIM-barrel protein
MRIALYCTTSIGNGSDQVVYNSQMPNLWKQLQLSKQPLFALAPLDGVTDYVFRQIVSEIAKPDVLFTEFTHTDALLSKGYSKTIERFRYSESQRPIVAQIWGNNPASFAKVATMVAELGFDGVDINMGCPDHAVMKSGGGAACISSPILATEIIQATKEGAGDLPVSVKTRIGVDKIITEEWIGHILQQNIAALTVHGRTAKEMSKVAAHWDEIGKALALARKIAPETVILGNGDIMSVQQGFEMHKKYGVDGIMVGRGIFGNPWFFELQSKEHTTEEHLQLLLKHTRLYCQTYPEPKRFDAIKKFFKNYVKEFPGSKRLKIALMEAENLQDVEQIVSGINV